MHSDKQVVMEHVDVGLIFNEVNSSLRLTVTSM